MPKKPKRRSVASYRAASLKAARTRRRMQQARVWSDYDQILKTFDDMLPPERTINRIPKVEWK